MSLINILAVALASQLAFCLAKKRKPNFYVVTLLVCVGLLMVLKSWLLDYYVVPTTSMSPSLNAGDLILAKPLHSTRDDIQRGDIVIFRAPAFHSFIYVKRIIGLSGDTVTYTEDKAIMVNGKVIGKLKAETATEQVFEAVQERNGQRYEFITDKRKTFVKPIYSEWGIPDGYVFVVGDNRDHSWDSRFWENPVGTPRHLRGLVKKELLISRYFYTVANLEFMKSDFDIGENNLKVLDNAQRKGDHDEAL
ncbi:signal peptidase I [Xenorhabdus bovienii]|uniref:signal peptidase I n=1 Tax=Xenorhabdus bovienii TaxID=40576 RepID=UPI00237CCEDE|nr:signal peptidase I [Xenorhabdus bovienii]MDE1491737.1 signal peptidase I [Xenorhabdus bovienii]